MVHCKPYAALDCIHIKTYSILLSDKARHNTQQEEIAAAVIIRVIFLSLLLPGCSIWQEF